MKSVYTYLTEKSLMGKPIKQRYNSEELITLSAQGKYEEAKKLLEDGVDADSYKDDNGDRVSALEMASAYQRLDIMKLLLDYGADINWDKDGWSPILWALSTEAMKSVDFLLDNGVDINVGNMRLGKPLAFYIPKEHIDEYIIKFSKHGYNFKDKEFRGISFYDYYSHELAKEASKEIEAIIKP